MTKSNYKYSIQNYAGRNVIVIEDLNLGNMSVTNDIENVVEEICNKEAVSKNNYMVIYKDSGGIFDGYDIKNNAFFFLDKMDWKSAVSKYADLQITRKEPVGL